MPLRFDATLKDLAKQYPGDFLAAFGIEPADPIVVLDVDLSTVTASADLVFGIGEPPAKIVHIDCQSSAAEDLPRQVMLYHALLHRNYRVPVHSIALVLRPQARHRNVTGTVRYETGSGQGKMDFGYQVISLWEQPVEPFLTGKLGTLPLAPLARLPEGVPLLEALTSVVQRLSARLQGEAAAGQARLLLTAAFVLTGMRVQPEVALEMFRGTQVMQESSTYQWIMEQGAIAKAQKTILRLGRKRFGDVDGATQSTLQGIADLGRLERLIDAVADANSWQELLLTV